MRPTKRFEQLLNDLNGASWLKDSEEYECDICGAGYAFFVGYSMWNCSVPQTEHKEWGEFWRPGYHVCLDCCEAGVAGFPDRLRKHAEALEERAAELRKLINAKWQEIELDDAAARDNDPIHRRFHISE
jgi:hypothetical protein